MGGDLAPKVTVEGAVLAARDFGAEVVLVGVRETLERELAAHDTTGLSLKIEHAPEIVAMDDPALESVVTKPNSSIHVGLEMVKRGDAHSFVSAGNSGAVMAAAMAILGNLAHVDRPAIASLVPVAGGQALLVDAGANLDVKPINLAQFAVMGSVYSRRVRNIARPRIGILSNGEESSKGTDLTRTAAAMLHEAADDINYIGYVEGRDINRGVSDVVVTDGFTGNVALKSMEGFASFLLGNLREVFGANLRGRLAYLLIRKNLKALRERLDPHEYGGAPLLGVNGVAIIAHGSSNSHAVRNAIRAAGNEALVRQVNTEIVEILGRHEFATAAKPSGKGFKKLLARMRERLHRNKEEETEHVGAEDHEAQPYGPQAPAREAKAPKSGATSSLKPPSSNGAGSEPSSTSPTPHSDASREDVLNHKGPDSPERSGAAADGKHPSESEHPEEKSS